MTHDNATLAIPHSVPTDSIATRIRAAKSRVLQATAALIAFNRLLDTAFPAPPIDCTEDVFEIWNDAFETANMERGGYRLADQQREAEDELIQIVRSSLRTEGTEADVAFAAALGERRGYVTARSTVLDLCIRLDPRTV